MDRESGERSPFYRGYSVGLYSNTNRLIEMTDGPTTDALEAKLRTLASRVAQLEDAVELYGPPPKRRRLPIPEITSAQREFLVWLAIFSTLSLITAAAKRRGAE